jgi:hypothetical protein
MIIKLEVVARGRKRNQPRVRSDSVWSAVSNGGVTWVLHVRDERFWVLLSLLVLYE